MSKILITGAAGFVGSHLVEHLLDCGVKRKDLRLFVLNGESLKNLPDEKFDIVYGDIRNKQDVIKAVKNVDVAYHLAALTRSGDCMGVNYLGTKILLSACKQQKVKRFVFFSTIAVYGLPAFVGDKTEIDELNRKEPLGDYALSKHKADLEVEKSELNYVIVRPTTVYGPRDKAGVYQLIQAIKKGYFFRIGKGENKIDYVYVRDLVKGARQAQLSNKQTDYILGAAQPITFLELISSVYKNLGKKTPNWYLPRSAGLVLAKFGSVLNLPISTDRVKVMTANYYFNSQKAKNEINYSPNTSLIDGITKCIQKINL